MVLLNQMIVLFIIMMLGFVCRKVGIFNDETVKKLSSLVVNVANPAMILSSAINPGDSIQGHDLLITSIVAIAMYAILLIFAEFVPRILHVPKSDYGIYKSITVFANIGFMGFPLIKAAYGSEALLHTAIFQLPFNLLVYTYGVFVICNSGNYAKESEGNSSQSAASSISFANSLKKMLNVGVLTCIVAITLFFLRPTVPSVIEDVFNYVGDMTPPLSMMIIGDSLSKINFKKLITNVQLLGYSIIKLLIIPIVGTLAAKSIGVSGLLLPVFMIMLATPAATMNVLLAQEYNSNYKTASEAVALSTVLSIITIPIVSMILGL